MSALVALVGDSGPQDLTRMVEAAPHRGTAGSMQTWEDGGAMVQEKEPVPFTRAGLRREDRFVAAVTGCLFEGASVVSGEEAARRIGAAYVSQGPSAIRGLRGSYAAAVIDLHDGRVFAVRSPMGERPLFWRRLGATLALASEVKQLRTETMEPAPPDEAAALATVTQVPLDPARTMFRGIQRVPAGTWFEFDGQDIRRGTLWEPRASVGTADIGPEDATREFRRLLRIAVERRLASDTVVLVSGGLDSTPVAVEAAALHRERFGEPLTAVSATYPEHPRVDESAYVGELEVALQLRMLWTQPRPRPFADLDRRILLHDGPALAPMEQNFAHILAAAREAGSRSVLDGHDGDTVFGSQPGLARALARRRAFRQWVRYVRFARDRYGIGWPTALKRYVAAPALPPASLDAYRRARKRSSFQDVPEWVQEPLRSSLEPAAGQGDWFAGEVARIEDGTFERALETVERVALAQGLAILHPLADPDLVDFLLSLPPEVKFADGRTKSLVRMAYPEIPAAIRNRVDKTLFNDLALAGTDKDDILGALRGGPQRLPGVDWDRLQARVHKGVPAFKELSLVTRVVQADHFLSQR